MEPAHDDLRKRFKLQLLKRGVVIRHSLRRSAVEGIVDNAGQSLA